MPLFPDYNSEGPGIPDGMPKLRGMSRIFEVLSRDFNPFMMAGFASFVTSLPLIFLGGYAIALHSVLFAILAGLIGGLIAAPCFYGMADVILRSLRDAPADGFHRYKAALAHNWKSTLVPGMVSGLIFTMEIFIILHLPQLGGIGLALCWMVSVTVFMGVFFWGLAQHVLLDLTFAQRLKNSLILYYRHIFKSLAAVGIMMLYLLVIIRMFPASLIIMLVTSLWLPLLLIYQIIYPQLDEIFGIEKKLQQKFQEKKKTSERNSE